MDARDLDAKIAVKIQVSILGDMKSNLKTTSNLLFCIF
jgi:hypothetical protein